MYLEDMNYCKTNRTVVITSTKDSITAYFKNDFVDIFISLALRLAQQSSFSAWPPAFSYLGYYSLCVMWHLP